MIVIKNKIIPFGGYSCINLLGIVFTKKDMDWRDYNHELLHSHQMLECMFFTVGLIMGLIALFDISPWWFLISPFSFYIYYGLEYLLIRAFIRNKMVLITMFLLRKKHIIMLIIIDIFLNVSGLVGLNT